MFKGDLIQYYPWVKIYPAVFKFAVYLKTSKLKTAVDAHVEEYSQPFKQAAWKFGKPCSIKLSELAV